jgi:hypothetical protein
MLRDFAGPSMLLVWHRLGSPKDPRGSVGLFCFADRKPPPTQQRFRRSI